MNRKVTKSGEGESSPLALPQQQLNQRGEFQMMIRG